MNTRKKLKTIHDLCFSASSVFSTISAFNSLYKGNPTISKFTLLASILLNASGVYALYQERRLHKAILPLNRPLSYFWQDTPQKKDDEIISITASKKMT